MRSTYVCVGISCTISTICTIGWGLLFTLSLITVLNWNSEPGTDGIQTTCIVTGNFSEQLICKNICDPCGDADNDCKNYTIFKYQVYVQYSNKFFYDSTFCHSTCFPAPGNLTCWINGDSYSFSKPSDEYDMEHFFAYFVHIIAYIFTCLFGMCLLFFACFSFYFLFLSVCGTNPGNYHPVEKVAINPSLLA